MMTRQLAIFTLTFMVFSCSTKEKRTVVKTFASGTTEKEVIYLNPQDTLEYSEVTYFENGKLKSYRDFHAGRFNGKIIDYYENGQKKFEGLTDMGLFIGTKTTYDSTGMVLQIDSLDEKCALDYCCCDGTVTRFFPNGKVKEKFTNKSGERTGKTQFWYSNGKLKMERTYLQGNLNGPTTEYYDTLTIHGQYLNGKEVGAWKYVDTLKRVIKTVMYKDGLIVE